MNAVNNDIQAPKVTYNAALDRLDGATMFPKNLAKANESLKKLKMPDEYYAQQAAKSVKKDD